MLKATIFQQDILTQKDNMFLAAQSVLDEIKQNHCKEAVIRSINFNKMVDDIWFAILTYPSLKRRQAFLDRLVQEIETVDINEKIARRCGVRFNAKSLENRQKKIVLLGLAIAQKELLASCAF